MIDALLLESPWPGLIVWAILYISDYVLTLVCARLYRERVAGRIVFEGSFELTPQFQADIDALRWVSPKFLMALATSSAMLTALWWLSSTSGGAAYQIALGAMVLVECAVHMRHFRNLHQFTTCFGPDGIRGRLEYPREVTLRLSAFDLFQFAVLYFLLFLVTESWLLLGGAASCFAQAVKHHLWLRAWRRTAGSVASRPTVSARVEA